MLQLMESKKWIKDIILWLMVVSAIYVMNILSMPLIVINLFFVVTTSIYFCRLWHKHSESKLELLLLLVGLGLRIVVCVLDIYGREFIGIPFSGSDSEGFYLTSVAYYYGDMSGVYTKYPYVINAMYQIVGLNRFAVQYVNILCWSFCAFFMQKSCKLLQINKFLRIIAIGLLSVLPFHICISSILMRDMIVTLSIMWATYCILKWMNDGKYTNLLIGVIVTVPVILLHNCVLAMLVVIGMMAALYAPEKRRFCIEKKAIVILTLGVVGIAAAIFVPSIRRAALSQIPIADGGILNSINARLHYFYTNTGGSTYLLNEYVDDYGELLIGTIQRIIYFLLSPVPWMWRGFSDMAGFLASTSMTIIAVFLMVISFIYKKKAAYRTCLFEVILFVSGIFAWGVSNGGTAMRHREKLLGVIILLGVYSVQLIINARKERTSCTIKES